MRIFLGINTLDDSQQNEKDNKNNNRIKRLINYLLRILSIRIADTKPINDEISTNQVHAMPK